jgi:TonB family protein
MGYQALLFCPDEKLARVVSQVFSELDFTVEPVHEPFAAVKKLMSQRYDALVVDCENEQNASLLFKSARNSNSNQSSLAIALVEGQTGVAKAYRIGANLVLTKPINVEQAKGTLRVARGLLRKNSDAAGTSTASASIPARPAKTAPAPAASFQPPVRSTATIAPPPGSAELTELQAPTPTANPATFSSSSDFVSPSASAKVEATPAVIPAPVAQTKLTSETALPAESKQSGPGSVIKNDTVKNDPVKNDPFKNDELTSDVAKIAAVIPAQNSGSTFTSASGSAAATAPAKETPAPATNEYQTAEPKTVEPRAVETNFVASETPESTTLEPMILEPMILESTISEAKTAQSEPAHSSSYDSAPAPLTMFSSLNTGDAPSFAALGEEDSEGLGSKKKILIAAAVVLLVATLVYIGYGKSGKSSATPAPQSVSAPQISDQTAAPATSPAASSSTIKVDQPVTATQNPAPKMAAVATADKSSSSAGNPPVIRIAANSEPETTTKKPETAPLLVKSNAGGSSTKASAEDSAPPLASTDSAASAGYSSLNGLMSSSSPSLPKPSLATMKVSQGVSQGLLIKRVQPQYPKAALAVHTQGAVEIEATITKDGNVINPTVLRGDPVLAHSALEAVRQWRYKPYYLDGQPVEIQTEITINFKTD